MVGFYSFGSVQHAPRQLILENHKPTLLHYSLRIDLEHLPSLQRQCRDFSFRDNFRGKLSTTRTCVFAVKLT